MIKPNGLPPVNLPANGMATGGYFGVSFLPRILLPPGFWSDFVREEPDAFPGQWNYFVLVYEKYYLLNLDLITFGWWLTMLLAFTLTLAHSWSWRLTLALWLRWLLLAPYLRLNRLITLSHRRCTWFAMAGETGRVSRLGRGRRWNRFRDNNLLEFLLKRFLSRCRLLLTTTF